MYTIHFPLLLVNGNYRLLAKIQYYLYVFFSARVECHSVIMRLILDKLLTVIHK